MRDMRDMRGLESRSLGAPEQAYKKTEQRVLGLKFTGWSSRDRTYIPGTKNLCPTIGRCSKKAPL